jgi:hypothetical protein
VHKEVRLKPGVGAVDNRGGLIMPFRGDMETGKGR